ncbi:MAG TPA: hypothetical protein VIN04_01000 [Myxococcota bacterium]
MRAPERALEVLSHLGVEAVAAGLELLEPAPQLGALALGLGAQAGRLAALGLERHAARVELRQRALEPAVRAREQLVGALQHVASQAHACGHRGGRRGARHAGAQPVGGRQRRRIELEARVLEARVDLRHLLEQAVVGGGDHARVGVGERLEHGLGQRGALAGIGAVADLVQHDEVVRARVVHDVSQVREVRREGGQALAQALGVADVGEQPFAPVDARSRPGRHVQPGVRAQHRERDRLHRDRLAARVGAGEHEHADRVAEPQVVGHRARGVEQRMAQLRQHDHALPADLRRARVPLGGQRAPREREVERGERVQARAQRGRLAAHRVGERAQDARRLARDAELRLLEPVVGVDHRLRLDEQRGAGGRGVVHDAGHVPARVGAHRQHEAVVAHRDEPVGQVRRDRGVGERRVEPALQLAGQAPRLGARLGEDRRHRIAHAPFGVERRADLVGQLLVIPERGAAPGQAGGDLGLAGEEARGGGDRLHHRRDVEQLAGAEVSATLRARQRGGDVGQPGERRRRRREHGARLVRLREPLAGLVGRLGKQRRRVLERAQPARGAHVPAQALHHLRPLQDLERATGNLHRARKARAPPPTPPHPRAGRAARRRPRDAGASRPRRGRCTFD